jgi:FkbM family methyltransferase
MYYKDKKILFSSVPNLKSINFLKTYMKLLPNDYRRYIIYSIILIVCIYFYKLSVYSSSTVLSRQAAYLDETEEFNKFIQIQKASDNSRSSMIIDALIRSEPNEIPDKPIYSLVKPYKNGIFFYEMTEPIETWWPFDCIETRMKKSINTKLCIHDPKYDKYVSGQLKENGLWEPTNVRTFLRTLQEIPDANVIDIGANIGLYSLLSAKMNRSVIAVEPLHENMNRLHKATTLERVQPKIVALINAVSNERKQLKLSIMDYNLGGSHVADDDLANEEERLSLTSSSVIVNSIILDDLLDVYDLKMPHASKKFVIKMDIEGYEPYAFEKGQNLFKKLQIAAVFMEVGKMVEKLKSINKQNYKNYLFKVKNMFRMLKEMNYEPYEVNGWNMLDYSKWMEDWPWDVYFRQCDLVNCPGHTYKLSGV